MGAVFSFFTGLINNTACADLGAAIPFYTEQEICIVGGNCVFAIHSYPRGILYNAMAGIDTGFILPVQWPM